MKQTADTVLQFLFHSRYNRPSYQV